MANGFGYGFPFHAHWVDVGGNEIRWTRQRDDFAFFDYRRVLAYRKPFLPLNNEFFDREFTGEIAEEYFRWALFYGFPPSCFAPGAGAFGNYWNTPEFHNRDRHLFRRYVPLIVRLCEAGWEPVTHAWSDNERVLVERFGRWSDGNLHFTIYNASDQLQNAIIAIDAAKLGLKERDARNLTIWVLTDLKTFPFAVGSTKFSPLTILLSGTLAPRETAVLWLTAPDKALASLAELAKVHLNRSVSKSQRRTQAPEQLLNETKQATDAQPKTLLIGFNGSASCRNWKTSGSNKLMGQTSLLTSLKRAELSVLWFARIWACKRTHLCPTKSLQTNFCASPLTSETQGKRQSGTPS